MKKYITVLLSVFLMISVLGGCKSETLPSESTQPPTALSASQAATVGTEQQPKTEATVQPVTQAATQAVTQPPAAVDPSWFDDAVFIGDSVTVALDYYCASDPDILGNAQFVCGVSLGYHNALWPIDSEYAVHPTYQGEVVLAETAAAVTSAKKVFIMLGVNDIGTYGADDTMDTAAELVDRILACTPDVDIYMQSTTPMVDERESDWLNNDKISGFNSQLKAYCTEKGYHFIDVYHQVCNDEGDLKEDYCSDIDVQGIHFTNQGCSVWAEYLKTAAAV